MIRKLITLILIAFLLFAFGCSSAKGATIEMDTSFQGSLSGSALGGSDSASFASASTAAGQNTTAASGINRQGQSSGGQVKQFFGNIDGLFTRTKGTFIGFLLYFIPILIIMAFLYFLLFGKPNLFRKGLSLVTSRR
ncbi:MAG: hypothetical protein LBI12_01950 [Treponema sp.]|jgi:hypothetical protein|nr:hypothetical protein [Treponema sp.]